MWGELGRVVGFGAHNSLSSHSLAHPSLVSGMGHFVPGILFNFSFQDVKVPRT